MMLDLSPEHLALVQDILKRHVPDWRVVVFGSRARQCARPMSDLDLCIMGNEPLTIMQLAALSEAFSESDLPMRVDIVDWATLSPEFCVIIEKDAVNIQLPND